ncbi:hypothetical protein EWB00_000063 [Schistosoma japonicum]|uniref:Uncharacterized protein n=1 Tax=Schistosoma japonicum TaxID=6182 RepID=A0A4Z2DKL4_SCHJA|nr:hypothetical protein KSF78_0003956 [Schistosoma japonicum]KAH8868300.1 hypothetical protein KSF78_0003956 [Schistosoma japonicum]TNN16937.1 hypothetical protein EWB00_000063 [Schistosoma japonicum]
MSCRRRSRTNPPYYRSRTLDDRLRDDYRYNYRGDRSSRYYPRDYDPYYSRPPSVYQPTETYYARPYESYYTRPPSVYQPTETLYPGSVREIYEPHTYSSYSPRRSFSNSRLVDPDTISNNGNTYSYSPNPRPKVEIWHTRGPYEGQYY